MPRYRVEVAKVSCKEEIVESEDKDHALYCPEQDYLK